MKVPHLRAKSAFRFFSIFTILFLLISQASPSLAYAIENLEETSESEEVTTEVTDEKSDETENSEQETQPSKEEEELKDASENVESEETQEENKKEQEEKEEETGEEKSEEVSESESSEEVEKKQEESEEVKQEAKKEVERPEFIETKLGFYESENLQVDKEYVLDEIGGVKIVFKTLPEGENRILIGKVDAENLKGATQVGSAYQVKSEMKNGTFTYDLYLPTAEEADELGVKYSEDGRTYRDVDGKREGEYMVLKGMDHFTVFVVVENSGDCPSGVTFGTDCFDSIQNAIDAAALDSTGPHTIDISSDSYSENILISNDPDLNGLVIQGTSGTEITQDSVGAGDSRIGVVQIENNNITLQDITIIPVNMAGISIGRFTESTGTNISNLTLSNVSIIGTNSLPCGEQERGLYVDNTSTLNGLTITDSEFTNLIYGWYFQKAVTADTSNVTNVNVSNSLFHHNGLKGIYAEKLDNAVFNDVTFNQNGYYDVSAETCFYFDPWRAGIDINLKAGTYNSIIFNNPTVTDNGIGATNGVGLTVKGRDDGPSYSTFPGYVNNVQINSGTFSGNENGIRIGEPGKNNSTPSTVEIHNASITGNIGFGLINEVNSHQVDATDNWWGDGSGPFDPDSGDGSNLDTNLGTGDRVGGAVNYSPWTTLGFIQGRTFIDQNSNGLLLSSDGDYTGSSEPGNDGRGMEDGFSVRLYDSSWTLIEEQTTNTTGAVGQYKFESISNGNYHVCAVDTTGYLHSPASIGQNVVKTDNSDAHPPHAQASIVNNSSGQIDESNVCWEVNINNNDGAYLGLGYAKRIVGTKFNDRDMSGTHAGQSGGEERLDNWTMNLYKENISGDWILYDSQITRDISHFDHPEALVEFQVTDGIYYYCEETKPNWIVTYPANIGDKLVYNDNQGNSLIPEYDGITVAVENLSPNSVNESDLCWQIVVNRGDNLESYGWNKFGNYEITNPGTPIQTGYNEKNYEGDNFAAPRDPNEISCTDGFTKINDISVHWSDQSTANPFLNSLLKYRRQYSMNGTSWHGNEIYNDPYTNYRHFGSTEGVEGQYWTRVKAFYDVNLNGQYDPGEPESNWSNECSITYDKTAPEVTINNPTDSEWYTGTINLKATCNETCDYVNFWWRNVDTGEVFAHYRYNYVHDDGTVFEWDLDTLNAELANGNGTPADPSDDYYVMQDGNYELYAAAKDLAGNWARSTNVGFGVDNNAPTAPSDLYFMTDSGKRIECGESTNENGITMYWTASDDGDGSGLSHYNYKVVRTDLDGNTNTWTTNISKNLTSKSFTFNNIEGKREITFNATDNVNLTSSNATCVVHYDTTPPAKPTGLERRTLDGTTYQCGDFAPRVTMIPDWDDNQEDDFSHYEYSSFWPDGHQGLDERIFTESEFVNSWTAPEDGTYGYSVRAVDLAGNKSDWAKTAESLEGSCQITYDNQAPTVPQNPTFLVETTDGTVDLGCGNYTNEYEIITDWDASDDGEGSGVAYYEYQSYNPPNGWVWPGGDPVQVYDTERTGRFTVGEGVYGFRVRAVDNVGNKSDWTTVDFENSCQITYDVSKPTIDTIPDQSLNEGDRLNLGILDKKGMWDETKLDKLYLSVDYTNLDGITVPLLINSTNDISDAGGDGTGGSMNDLYNELTGDSIKFASYELPVDTSIIPEGTYTFNYYVTDKAGNRSDCYEDGTDEDNCEFSITINNVAPQVTLTADQTINEGETATFTGSFTDPSYINDEFEVPDGMIQTLATETYQNNPDDGPWTVEIDYDYDGITFTPDATATMEKPGDVSTVLGQLSYTYENEGTYTVRLRVIENNEDADFPMEPPAPLSLLNKSANSDMDDPFNWGGEGEEDYAEAEVTVNALPTPDAGGEEEANDNEGDVAGATTSPTFYTSSTQQTGDVNGDGATDEKEEEEKEGDVLGEETCEEKSPISGYIYYDQNDNDTKDENEKGVEDVKVVIYQEVEGEEKEVATVRTDENGYWQADVCPGEYKVRTEELPENTKIKGDEVLTINVPQEEGRGDVNFIVEDEGFKFNWAWCLIPLALFALLILFTQITKRRDEKEVVTRSF